MNTFGLVCNTQRLILPGRFYDHVRGLEVGRSTSYGRVETISVVAEKDQHLKNGFISTCDFLSKKVVRGNVSCTRIPQRSLGEESVCEHFVSR